MYTISTTTTSVIACVCLGVLFLLAVVLQVSSQEPKQQGPPVCSTTLTITDVSAQEVIFEGRPVYELLIQHRLALEKGDFTPEFIKEQAARPKVDGANYFVRRKLLYASEFQASRAVCIFHHHQENNLSNKFVVNSKGEWLAGFYPVDAQ